MMRLQLSSKAPTPLQKLALEIMAYTFPLLSVEISPAQLESVNPRNRYRKAKIDAYMQAVHHAWANNLPVPPPPAVDDRLPAPAANRQIIVRVGVDAVLLVLRASMVYWFLRPFTRTITGVAFVGWILYEIWQLWTRPNAAAQHAAAAGQGQRPAGAGAAIVQNNNQNAGGGAPAGPVVVPGANGAVAGGNAGAAHAEENAALVGPARGNLRNFWQRCARFGIDAEARASLGVEQPNGGRTHTRLPWRHRVVLFFVMLVLTVHPQYWTERQQLLRERERELRVLYGPLREDGEEEGEQGGQVNGAGSANGLQEANGDSKEKSEKPAPAPKPPLPGGFVGQYVNRARRGIL
jgi:hypothetical protein